MDTSTLIGISTRDAFGKTLAELANEDQRIVALTADLASSVRLADMIEIAPERVFNFGIAEQDMMGAAAGLALCGKIPFVTTFAAFASLRAAEQAHTDIAYNGLPVRICASHGGFDWQLAEPRSCVGRCSNLPEHARYDSHCPGRWNGSVSGYSCCNEPARPSYIRLSRPVEPTVYTKYEPLIIGKARRVKTGKDLTFIAYGGSVGYFLKAAEILAADGVDAGVIDMATIKPLDKRAVLAATRNRPPLSPWKNTTLLAGWEQRLQKYWLKLV